MKFRAYAIYVAAILIATVLAFVLPPEQAQMARIMAIMFTVVTIFSALVTWRKGADFVLGRSKLVMGVGWAVVGLSVIGFIAGMVAAINSANVAAVTETYTMTSILAGVIGSLIISAPRITRQSQDVRARMEARKAAKAAGKTDAAFDGIQEGEAALKNLAREWLVLLEIAWPYVLASSAGMSLVVFFAGQGKDAQVAMLASLGVTLLGLLVGLPATAVAWHRWVLEKRKPKTVVALPDGTTFSYAWRLWIFTSLSNRVTSWAGEAVVKAMQQAHLPRAELIGSLSEDILFALICAFVSTQALRLPAVAVRDKGFTQPLAMMEGRKLWPQLAAGLLVSISPFLLLRLLIDVLQTMKTQPTWLLPATAAVQIAFLFVGYAAAVTFLSRGYLEIKARLSNV